MRLGLGRFPRKADLETSQEDVGMIPDLLTRPEKSAAGPSDS